ncbi:hypothetical protein BYT27DRAFT_7218443 [Phlegmacium glaucopus]|nr:hypothetical protein BYT27DRAFT_7218443 [Phlegmacium glaucopus]
MSTTPAMTPTNFISDGPNRHRPSKQPLMPCYPCLLKLQLAQLFKSLTLVLRWNWHKISRPEPATSTSTINTSTADSHAIRPLTAAAASTQAIQVAGITTPHDLRVSTSVPTLAINDLTPDNEWTNAEHNDDEHQYYLRRDNEWTNAEQNDDKHWYLPSPLRLTYDVYDAYDAQDLSKKHLRTSPPPATTSYKWRQMNDG